MNKLLKELLREGLEDKNINNALFDLKKLHIDDNIYTEEVFFNNPTTNDRPLSSIGEDFEGRLIVLPIKYLIPTQKTMSARNIRHYIKNDFDKPITVFKIDKNFYIKDGHHRTASMILKNVGNVNAKLIDIDSLYNNHIIDDETYYKLKQYVK